MNQADLQIIYEDNHIIAVHKPSGITVQGDDRNKAILPDFVKQYIKEKYNKPGDVFLGVAHRLDLPVSGIVLFARTTKMLVRLNELFREKTIQKTYWAIVKNKPPKTEDILCNYIIKNESIKKAKIYNKEIAHSKYCELSYKLLASSDNYHLLEVLPKTGRFHQIRAQLANIGCPIKGDLKYGFPRSNENGFIHLHARKLEFLHPVKKEPVSIVCPLPNEILWKTMDELLK